MHAIGQAAVGPSPTGVAAAPFTHPQPSEHGQRRKVLGVDRRVQPAQSEAALLGWSEGQLPHGRQRLGEMAAAALRGIDPIAEFRLEAPLLRPHAEEHDHPHRKIGMPFGQAPHQRLARLLTRLTLNQPVGESIRRRDRTGRSEAHRLKVRLILGAARSVVGPEGPKSQAGRFQDRGQWAGPVQWLARTQDGMPLVPRSPLVVQRGGGDGGRHTEAARAGDPTGRPVARDRAPAQHLDPLVERALG